METVTAGLSHRVTHLENQDAAQWDQMRRYEEQHARNLEALHSQIHGDYRALMDAVNANKIAWSSMSTGTRVVAWITLALISLGSLATAFFGAIRKFFTGG